MGDQLTTPQVTPANQWKRQTEILSLPSGVVVELQRPSTIDTILTNGNLPEGLANVMIDAFVTGGQSEFKMKGEDLPAFADLVNTLCRAAFVSPKIVAADVEPNYDANEISINDVKDIDRMFILGWVTKAGGKAAAVTKFSGRKQKQMANLPSGPNGKAVRTKTG